MSTSTAATPHLSSVLPKHILTSGDHHPIVLAEAKRRAASVQLRIADAVTAFAGSMRFVYLHAVVFAGWMLFFEPSPWPTLTLVVSLEAIFLSTFVMIGQNRQAGFQQAKADHDFKMSDQEPVDQHGSSPDAFMSSRRKSTPTSSGSPLSPLPSRQGRSPRRRPGATRSPHPPSVHPRVDRAA
ncbi:DUF1003 domain-containing protein [Cryobacterium breve]|uniref:DUF1003 domain-containing protein n=1 Tax=Cryobacterium breve TaxID=1259258 RepID=UPI00248CDE58|nr:DUF1003 domain-containing protein [Cryobacterium breve]